MLYLEHCIISINNSNFQIFSKFFFLENIMENGTFAPLRSKCSIFHNILKKSYILKVSKGAVWSKGLKSHQQLRSYRDGVIAYKVSSNDWEHSGSVVECLTRDRGAGDPASPAALHCVLEQEH